jgi:site-specific recombinase XerD
LGEHIPPFANKTRISRLIVIRRLLEDLAAGGHPVEPDLIRAEDFPRLPRYLPRPLSPQDDQLLQQELRRTDDLPANALLLTRANGIRIGECIDLALDCLRPLGSNQWALHVPIGKVYTERLVPADADVQRWVARILDLRALAPLTHLANSEGLLLPRSAGRSSLAKPLRQTLADAAKRAGCSCHVTPHRLRHSFATEMLRLGVSLPALMQLLGHNDIRMTLRYLEVTQPDLQREFHFARQNVARLHHVPTIVVPTQIVQADLPGIRQAIAATRHLLEQFRRQLADEKTQRKLQRLDKRLLNVASQLDSISTPEK